LEGWGGLWRASKGMGPLPRRRGSALAHGCGREGSGALPLARAAVISTGLRVPRAFSGPSRAACGALVSVSVRVRVRVRVRVGVKVRARVRVRVRVRARVS